MPCTASKDLATIASQELIHALLNPDPDVPCSTIGTDQIQALRQLAAIFDDALPGDVPTGNLSPGAAPSPHGPPRVRRVRPPPSCTAPYTRATSYTCHLSHQSV
jgi:hypothetical protein